MLKIWGRPDWLNIQKVLWTCEELRLPFRRFDPDRPATAHPGRPFADESVPMVNELGLVVWEGHALMRYLFTQFGAPATPAQHESSDRWVDWSTFILLPSVRLLGAAAARNPSEAADSAAIRSQEECAAHALKLDAALARCPFLCGDALGMADIAVGATVWHWLRFSDEATGAPHVAAWLNRLRARAGYERHVVKPLAGYRAPRAATRRNGVLAAAG